MSLPLVLGVSSSDAASGVGIPLALTAGLVSFLSPCVLPLVPGYISTVVGVTPAEIASAKKLRMLGPSLLFILGFSVIFILMGLGATAIGSSLNAHRQTLELAGGSMILAMGVIFLLSPFVSVFNFEWHPTGLLKLAGRGGPVVAGAAFAIAWTPCTSITLGAILTQAAVSSSAAHGAVLLAFYSAGLAIPFLLITLAFDRAAGALGFVKRHFPVVIGIGGAVLIALGVLIVSGEFTILNSQANSLMQGTGLEVSGI